MIIDECFPIWKFPKGLDPKFVQQNKHFKNISIYLHGLEQFFQKFKDGIGFLRKSEKKFKPFFYIFACLSVIFFENTRGHKQFIYVDPLFLTDVLGKMLVPWQT